MFLGKHHNTKQQKVTASANSLEFLQKSIANSVEYSQKTVITAHITTYYSFLHNFLTYSSLPHHLIMLM